MIFFHETWSDYLFYGFLREKIRKIYFCLFSPVFCPIFVFCAVSAISVITPNFESNFDQYFKFSHNLLYFHQIVLFSRFNMDGQTPSYHNYINIYSNSKIIWNFNEIWRNRAKLGHNRGKNGVKKWYAYNLCIVPCRFYDFV